LKVVLMGKGGRSAAGDGGLVNADDEVEYTWEEVRTHNKTENGWIVIGSDVYDIGGWSRKHPGGSRVLGHYAGQDASEAFKAFHTNMPLVSKFMKPIRVGKVAPSCRPEEDEMRRDFAELRRTAEKMNLFTPSVFFYVFMLGHLLFFELLAYLTMYHFGTGWLPYILSLIFMTIVQAQAGWSQHDFGHLSVFKDNRINHAFHYFVMNLLKGASTSWWQHLHNQHHAKPNVIDKDPDVRVEAVFVLGEEMPKRVAKKKQFSLPYNWQHCYFFAVGPPLLFPIYFQFMIFRHPIIRKQWLDVFLMTFFYIKMLVLYGPMLGVFGAIKYLFLLRCLDSHWFVWVSQSNHIPMEIVEDKERPWLSMQLLATCDIEQSRFNDWFTGHLNFQIEHHLFPTMPRHNLYKIQPYAMALCKKHGLPYQVKTLSTAFRDIVKSLKHSGEIWLAYRDAYNIS